MCGGPEMNDITVYFGKINLISEHIYKVYSNELQMRDIMLDILGYFQHGMYYDEEFLSGLTYLR